MKKALTMAVAKGLENITTLSIADWRVDVKTLERFMVVYMHPQAHGFSRKKDILAMAGLSTPNVLDWFRGTRRPGVESLQKMAVFLEGVTVVEGLSIDPIPDKRRVNVSASDVDPKAVLDRHRSYTRSYSTGVLDTKLDVGTTYRFTFLRADGRTKDRLLSSSARYRFVGKVLGEFPHHYLLQVGGHKECLLKNDLRTVMFIRAEEVE